MLPAFAGVAGLDAVSRGNSIRGAGSSAANWPANRPSILCVAFGRGDTNLVKNAAVQVTGVKFSGAKTLFRSDKDKDGRSTRSR